MTLTVFSLRGIPGHRRERIEAAVIAGGNAVMPVRGRGSRVGGRYRGKTAWPVAVIGFYHSGQTY
jgi:hypothetical protein